MQANETMNNNCITNSHTMSVKPVKFLLVCLCILVTKTTRGVDGQCTTPPINVAVYEGTKNISMMCGSPTKVSWTLKPTTDPITTYQITKYYDVVLTSLKNLFGVDSSSLLIKTGQGLATVAPISTAGLYVILINGSTTKYGAKLTVVRQSPTCNCIAHNSTKINISCSLTYADSSYHPVNTTITWTSDGNFFRNDTPVRKKVDGYYVSTSIIIVDANNPANYQCNVTFGKPYDVQYPYVATNAPAFSASCTSPFCGYVITTLPTSTTQRATTSEPKVTGPPSTTEPRSTIEPLLTTTGHILTSTEATLTTTEQILTNAEPILTTGPILAAEPILTTAEPILTTTEPILTTTEPIPTTTEPLLATTEPIHRTIEPILTTTEPVLTTAEPMLTTTEPIPTTTEPILTTAEPILTTAESIPTTTEPIRTTTEPIPTTTEPILTATQPILTTTRPILTTTEPTLTTTQPLLTTIEPILTTNEPTPATTSIPTTDEPLSTSEPRSATAREPTPTTGPTSTTILPITTVTGCNCEQTTTCPSLDQNCRRTSECQSVGTSLTDVYNECVVKAESYARCDNCCSESLICGVVVTLRNDSRWLIYDPQCDDNKCEMIVVDASCMSTKWKLLAERKITKSGVGDYIRAGDDVLIGSGITTDCSESCRRMMALP